MQAGRFSQTFVNLYHTTCSYISEYRNIHASRENTTFDEIIIDIFVTFNQAHAVLLLHYIASCYNVDIYLTTLFFEGPRSRCCGRTAALRLFVQPCDEDERKMINFFFMFPSNGTPVE
jgi:hypothetical protein